MPIPERKKEFIGVLFNFKLVIYFKIKIKNGKILIMKGL